MIWALAWLSFQHVSLVTLESMSCRSRLEQGPWIDGSRPCTAFGSGVTCHAFMFARCWSPEHPPIGACRCTCSVAFATAFLVASFALRRWRLAALLTFSVRLGSTSVQSCQWLWLLSCEVSRNWIMASEIWCIWFHCSEALV